jgi:mRNA interferase RelE/StbE
VPFALEYRRSALRELEALPVAIRSRIDDRVTELVSEPYARGALKLHGGRNEWRVRVGHYRVLYEIDTPGRRIIITAIRHRREAYRDD